MTAPPMAALPMTALPMKKAERKILAIDTATEACSVALHRDGVVTQRLEITAGHSRRVLGMAQTLLRQSGLALDELDALAVDVGPGSFTGVRIGLGVAQGLAYGAGLKVIPVGALEALAYAVSPEPSDSPKPDSPRPPDSPEPSEPDSSPLVLAAIDARMGQVYYALYRTPPGNEPQAILPPALSAPERLRIGKRRGIIGAGSGWDRYGPVLLEALNGSQPVARWLPGRHPEAATVARLAAARGLQSAVSPLCLTASYIRNEVAEPSAERERRASKASPGQR